MKKNLQLFCSLLLMVVMVSGAVLTSAQQQRQPASADVIIERSGTGPIVSIGQGPDNTTWEREVTWQGQGPGPGPGEFVFLATEMSFGGALVKGAPYSAQAVTESVQTLADGNRIINRTTAAVYRDSEGRTRREQTLKSIGAYSGVDPTVTVFINDPVAGTSYTLDQRTMTARKMMPMRFKVAAPNGVVGNGANGGVGTGSGGGSGAGVGSGTGNADAKAYHEGVGQVILERSQNSADHYKVMVEGNNQREKRSIEAGVAMGIMSTRNRSAKTESLGKQNVNGVEAEGTRTTVTIPAGEIGNERAIEMVSERWYSPELQVIVMTRHTDPRFGENSYQLTNIVRSEPARDLFEVPAGYNIREMGGGVPATAPAGGINGGTLNGKAITLPLPRYPEIARQAKAAGTVTVQITIDEDGNVISAQSVSGHPLLREAALTAARDAKFSPTKLSGQAVKVNGTLVYNFVAQ
jgi:TonB family protein